MTTFSKYTKFILESIIKKERLKIDYIPQELVEFAKINKILYLLGFFDDRIRSTNDWNFLYKRRKLQLKTIVEAINLAENLGIEILIVKTLKPFEYAPDDIDVLIPKKSHLCKFVDHLKKHGYVIHKKGTPEVTIRKIINGIIIDIDVHEKLGAGPYEYIDRHHLFNRHILIDINGAKIPIPSYSDELLITVAHAVLKEFKVTLADIIHLIYSNENTIMQAKKLSYHVGLTKALRYILCTTYNAVKLSNATYNYSSNISELNYPIRIPISTIISSYLENIKYRIGFQGLLPLKELLKAPSSKGIANLVRYVGI